MKFTLNWLREYTDIDLPVAVVADRLTMLGLEVDNVSEYVEARVRGYLKALSNGRLADIARGHRELCTIRDARALYSHEAGMLDNIRQWLAEELSVATKVTPAELEARLHRACE